MNKNIFSVWYVLQMSRNYVKNVPRNSLLEKSKVKVATCIGCSNKSISPLQGPRGALCNGRKGGGQCSMCIIEVNISRQNID